MEARVESQGLLRKSHFICCFGGRGGGGAIPHPSCTSPKIAVESYSLWDLPWTCPRAHDCLLTT